ncbi:MAG: T9SS type A sorting domain-containing protein [Bacteroidota bacterium]
MKRIFTFFIAVLFACSLMAQQTSSDDPFRFDGYAPINQNALMAKHQMRATKELPIGWMTPSWNLLDYFWTTTSMVTHYANVMFPDSAVVYESGGTTVHNWLNSVGGVFDPYSMIFDSMQSNLLIPITQPYRIDSIMVLAWYNVVNSSEKDTLIIEIENGAPTVAPEFAWTVFSYPTDTFDVSPPKVMGNSLEKGFQCKMTATSKTIIKYPLTLADSTNNLGKYITIPVNYNVPAGKVVGISITYVTGASYSYGDVLFSYSHTSVPVLNSIRMGLYGTTNTTTDPHVFADPYLRWNSHHYINTNIRYSKYTGTNAWRNERMASTMSWGFDIGYYVTNTSNIGIAETPLSETRIYPNPAKEFVMIEHATIGSQVKVYDLLGNLILHKTIEQKSQYIDLQSLQNGVYFVEISIGNQAITRKLVRY